MRGWESGPRCASPGMMAVGYDTPPNARKVSSSSSPLPLYPSLLCARKPTWRTVSLDHGRVDKRVLSTGSETYLVARTSTYSLTPEAGVPVGPDPLFGRPRWAPVSGQRGTPLGRCKTAYGSQSPRPDP